MPNATLAPLRVRSTHTEFAPAEGYAGPMRPDHVPTMHGESNDRRAYGTLGRLFAIGYIRGLEDSIYGKPPIPSKHKPLTAAKTDNASTISRRRSLRAARRQPKETH